MKKRLKSLFLKFGIGVTSRDRLSDLTNTETLSRQLLENFYNGTKLEGQSKAQLHQDIIVLLTTHFKKKGYFVEFGATNGVDLSNTYLLEKHFQWDGILAEPEASWHQQLKQNRHCNLELDCVWHTTGEILKFNSVETGELSTIAEYTESDEHSINRKAGTIREVTSISLTDLLLKHNAPKLIDYLSIDTEGSEFEILNAFDFTRHKVAIIHVEHNHVTEKRNAIFQLLARHGYQRHHQNLSKWDDWYYREDLITNNN